MEIRVTPSRFGHEVRYQVERTATGWTFRYLAVGGDADPSGRPGLITCLDQDVVSYPSALQYHMQALWERANREGWADARVQQHLDAIGQWITMVERLTPPDAWDS